MAEKMKTINTMEELLENIKDYKEQMKSLADNIGKDKWVVASNDYVNVGSVYGLNGTDFRPKSPPANVKAQIFSSEEEAMKFGMDYHIKDGRGESIIPKVIPAETFFREEIRAADMLLVYLGIMAENTMNNIQLIDLGLPSGTLWADRNVGADAQEGYGDYFRFGKTTPFTENSPSYKYEDMNDIIAGTDKDAATTILGAQFRMPTIVQIKELLDYCSRQWTQVNEVKGTMATGPNGNSIFLPAAGYRNSGNGSLDNVGSYGNYWSASPYRSEYGRTFYLGPTIWYWLYDNRAYGLPVRPVNG